MIYNIRQSHYRNPSTNEYQIILPDNFEFSECLGTWERKGYSNYLCVIQEASKYKDILENLEGDPNIYYLPFDTVILGFVGIQFLGSKPPIISLEELNQKLEVIRKNVVWVELQTSTSEVLSLYRLAYVKGEDDVTTNYINVREFCGEQEIIFKSLVFSEGNRILDIEEEVSTFGTDNRYYKTLTGEEANKLWRDMVDKVLENVEGI